MIFGRAARMLSKLRAKMIGSSRDWSKSPDTAMLKWLLLGWGDAKESIAYRYGWSSDLVRVLDETQQTLRYGAPSSSCQVGVLIPYCPATDRVLMFWRKQDRVRDTGPAWEFSGGECRKDETPDQAARREMIEEAGIEFTEVLEYIGTCRFHRFTFSDTPQEMIVHRFMVEVPEQIQPRLPTHEVYEHARWFGRDEIVGALTKDPGDLNTSITYDNDPIAPMDVSFLHAVFAMAEAKRLVAERLKRRTSPCEECGGAPAAENCICLPF